MLRSATNVCFSSSSMLPLVNMTASCLVATLELAMRLFWWLLPAVYLVTVSIAKLFTLDDYCPFKRAASPVYFASFSFFPMIEDSNLLMEDFFYLNWLGNLIVVSKINQYLFCFVGDLLSKDLFGVFQRRLLVLYSVFISIVSKQKSSKIIIKP